MSMRLQDWLYALQIRWLLIFSPITLFDRIGRLDWYRNTLQDWLAENLPETGCRVLEIGCATGRLTEHVFDRGYEIAGVDLSQRMLKQARQRRPEIVYAAADAGALPFREKCFDMVYSASLVNLLPDPAAFARQILRVCKPGGRITVLFPVEGFTDEDFCLCLAGLEVTGFSKAALAAWHRNAPKISIAEVKGLLDAVGFECCETAMSLNGMVASVSARKRP